MESIRLQIPALARRLVQLTSALSFASGRLDPDPLGIRVEGVRSLPRLIELLDVQGNLILGLATRELDPTRLELITELDEWTPASPDKPATLYIDAVAGLIQTIFDYEQELELLGQLVDVAPVEASHAYGQEVAVFGTALELLRVRVTTLRRFV